MANQLQTDPHRTRSVPRLSDIREYLHTLPTVVTPFRRSLRQATYSGHRNTQGSQISHLLKPSIQTCRVPSACIRTDTKYGK